MSLQREILSPVTTAGLLYPALHTLVSQIPKKQKFGWTAMPNMIARNFFQPYSLTASNSVTFPKQSGSPGAVVDEVAEGAEIPLDVTAYSAVTVVPKKVAHGFVITREMIEDSLIPVQQDQLVRSSLRVANKIDRDCVDAINTGASGSVTATGKSLALDGTEFVLSGSGGPGIGMYISPLRNSVNDIITAKSYVEGNNYMPDRSRRKNKTLNRCLVCSKETLNKKYCSRKCAYESLRRGEGWKDPKIRQSRIDGLKRAHKKRKDSWYQNITKNDLSKKLSNVSLKNWESKSFREQRAKSLNKTMKNLRQNPQYRKSISEGLKKSWQDPLKREHWFNGMKNAKKQTKIEKMIQEEIKKRNLPLEYHLGVGHFCIPDHVSYKYKLAVFDDGDYWHANPKRFSKNLTKAQKHNLENDKKVNAFLEQHKWIVLRFWETDIKNDVKKCVDEIEKVLNFYASRNLCLFTHTLRNTLKNYPISLLSSPMVNR